MIIDAFLPPVVALLNRGIHSRQEAAEMCAELVGRSFVTRIEGLPTGTLSIRIAASYDGVDVATASDEQVEAADAVISGTPLELRRLIFVERDASIRSGRVAFDGDIEVAEKFRELLLTARPDFEGRLAAWVGEPAAFRLTSMFYDAQDWAMDLSDEVAARTREYLWDNARHVPTPEEANEFCAAVDELANDVDRLEARLDRIRAAGAPR